MIKVTFKTQTGHEVVEYFREKPMANGFLQSSSIKGRAMCFGWIIIQQEKINDE